MPKIWVPDRRLILPSRFKQRGMLRLMPSVGLWGGPRIIDYVISSNQTNFDLSAAVTPPGTPVTIRVTINSGVYVYSTSTSTPGFTTGAGWATGSKLLLICNGYIMGMGGAGATYNSFTGSPGGNALDLTINADVDSSVGYILGGGGGGAGDWNGLDSGHIGCGGGGGAGGGAGGQAGNGTIFASGGSGGGPGSSGGNGSTNGPGLAGGGGGGRVGPGASQAGPSISSQTSVGGNGGQAGGSGSAASLLYTGGGATGGTGGGPGSAGSVGSRSGTYPAASSGGGGWGAAGAAGVRSGSGGAAGKAVEPNGNVLTWLGGFPTGHVYGATS